jgi:hypothetical protein
MAGDPFSHLLYQWGLVLSGWRSATFVLDSESLRRLR